MAVYEKYFVENKEKRFSIYAYSPPTDGSYWIDDTYYYTEDFRTVERYKEYRDCGFNTLFMQRTAPYNGEDWQTSQTKLAMERGYQAGIHKIIIVDERIFKLSTQEGGIVGEGKRFATEDELDDFLRECIKDYKHQKGFIGVQIVDEPFNPLLKSVGEVFRAMKRVDKNVLVHCNLNPMTLPTLNFRISPGGRNMAEAYENYLITFLKETQSDYIMVDTYPFYRTPDKSNFNKYYFVCLEIIARVCKKYKKQMHMVMQAFGMNIGNKPYHIWPNKYMFEYQKNAMLCFGVKEFSYFTYWTKQANKSTGEMFPDGKAMMTRHGEKTKAYYYAKKVNEELNNLAPILCDFEYQANTFINKPPLFTRPVFLDMVLGGSLSKNVKDISIDKEIVLVSELYDKKHDQYMYSVMNAANPTLYLKKYKREQQITEITFSEEFDFVDIYYKGKFKTLPLKEGKLKIGLYSAEGILIFPYKEKK